MTVSINATVYEASYSYTLAIKNGSSTYLTISGLSWTKGTATRTVTLTAAQRTTLLNAMASIKSFTGTFAVTTYSGSTQIGSTSSKTAVIQTTSANSAPTLSGFTFEDSYSTTANITGNNQLFIQGYSTLKVTPGTATAKNGASISNYTASCNGLSASSSSGAAITVGKIEKSGSVSVTLTVTDSRGYTSSVTKNVTVIAYAKPKISSVTLRRTNEIEAEMQLKFNGSISAVTVDGTQKNSVQYVRYRYKKTSAASYGSYTSILSSTTRSGTSFSFSNLELCSLDAGYSYDFHLQIQDRLYSQSSLDLYFVIPQGTPLVALRKKKVGINKPTPSQTLDVGGNISADGLILMSGYNIMGLVQASIPDDTDLNTITTPGIYFRRNVADTSLHYPSTSWGMLEVFSWKNLHLNPPRHKVTLTDAFQGKIRCAKCGNTYHRVNSANKWVYWYCMGKKKKGMTCDNINYTDFQLRQITAHILGLEDFDEQVFSEQIEGITVLEDGNLEYHFYRGRTERWQRV